VRQVLRSIPWCRCRCRCRRLVVHGRPDRLILLAKLARCTRSLSLIPYICIHAYV
jgi:hypothetical protein